MSDNHHIDVRIFYEGDKKSIFTERIDQTSIQCPFCHTTIMPIYMLMADIDEHRYNVFCQCPNCKETFILEYERFGMSQFNFKQIHPNPTLQKRSFDDIIIQISPLFSEIYNQSYGAMQLGLSQICGMGYRKALEYIVKDYAIYTHPESKESIKKVLLGTCINNYISDTRIKDMANRAAWLGNDETHYVKLYDDKDITDLMALIDLTIYWIQMEERTKKYYQEIQKRQ